MGCDMLIEQGYGESLIKSLKKIQLVILPSLFELFYIAKILRNGIL